MRRLEAYRKEIRLIRQERDDLTSMEREDTKEICAIWKTLRKVREKNEFNNTDTKLVIIKVSNIALKNQNLIILY